MEIGDNQKPSMTSNIEEDKQKCIIEEPKDDKIERQNEEDETTQTMVHFLSNLDLSKSNKNMEEKDEKKIEKDNLERDEYGFVIEKDYVNVFHHFLLSKHKNRIEKLKNKWKEVKFGETMILDKKKLRALASSGITNELRGAIWSYCSGANRKKSNANFNSETGNYYQEQAKKSLVGKHLAAYDEIEKDVSRTFPEIENFGEEAKAKLKRILFVYAKRNKSLGYCQSMNFIAGYALLFMEEEEAFWLLATIIEDILPGCYSKNMVTIQVFHRILNELLAEKMPELHKHFEKSFVSLPLITTKWIMLLFVSSLPNETVVRIWDTLFFDGIELIFRISLGIFKIYEQELLNTKNPIQICNILKQNPMGIFDWKILFKPALKFDFDSERIELMKIKHTKEILKEIEEMRQKKNLRELTKVTRFTAQELMEMRKQFSIVASNKTEKNRNSEVLDFSHFKKVFSRIFPNWDEFALIHLFQVFDQDKDEVIDFRELMVGLSTLTKGTTEERLEICFKTFDVNNDGNIEKEEMAVILSGIYKNLFSSTEDIGRKRSVTGFVDMCFANLDSDNDGKLSFEEFKKVILIEPQILEAFSYDVSEENKEEERKVILADTESIKEEVISSPSAPPEWEPDKAVSRCPHCSLVFVFPVKRRHHCRNCGKVVCQMCSQHSLPLPKYGFYRPVRVCSKCFTASQKQKSEKRSKRRTTHLP